MTLGKSRYSFLNTLKGVLIGAPLGVCVNCAAPIGQGLHAAGEAPATASAAMISSPTLNIVVLTLVFGLFPFHFAAVKVGLTAVLLLAILPAIAPTREAEAQPTVDRLDLAFTETWGEGLKASAQALRANLIYIVRETVPLMLAAGILGAAVVAAIPLDSLADLDDSLGTVAGVAAIGTLLPVPITFDVIVAYTLWQAGLPPVLAMVLLFTLGAFSIYPAGILWRAGDRMLSGGLFAAVMVLGMVGGIAVGAMDAQSEALVIAHLDTKPPIKTLPQRISELCQPIEGPARAQCAESLTIFLARQDDGVKFCETLPTPRARASCAFNTLTHQVVPGTVDLMDVQRLCAQLAPANQSDVCVLEAAVLSGDEAVCNALVHPQAKRECRDRVVFARVTGETRVEDCETVVEPMRPQCRQEVVTLLASDSANPDVCNQLEGLELRDQCRLWVQTYTFLELGDSELCPWFAEHGHTEMHQQCVRFCEMFPAIRSGDPGRCQQLAGPDRGYCVQHQLSKVLWMAEHLRTSGGDPMLPDRLEAVATRPVEAARPKSNSPLLMVEHRARVQKIQHGPQAGDGRFHLQWASEVGLQSNPTRPPLYLEPFVYGRGIAAGDVDGDQRIDLVFAQKEGVILHQNDGGRFTAVPVVGLDGLDVMEVALVDLDDDGLLDLYVTSYGGTNRVVYNDGDRFAAPQVVDLPASDRLLTLATAFGDLDRDGDLDLVLGNWSFGSAEGFNPVHSGNEIVWNTDAGFVLEAMDDVPGETLSLLLTDFDADGWLDLFVANDGPGPDQVYRGAEGTLVPVSYSDGIVPVTPWFSMSWDAGDANNDGHLDLFGTDMSFGTTEGALYCDTLPESERETCESMTAVRHVVRNYDIEACEDPDCEAAVVLQLALDRGRPELCTRLPASSARRLCEARLAVSKDHRTGPSEAFIPAAKRNVLLLGDGKQLVEADRGVEASWWTWNARFVDVDSDGWQDIFAGNGYALNGRWPGQLHSNVLFLNQGGERFEQGQEALGLTDRLHTPTWVFEDLDGDGDLDLVAPGILAPARVAWNGVQNHSLSVRLVDHIGSRHGIGARVVIHTAEGKQLREIRASGGFLSHQAPLAHFGLGEGTVVDRIEVRWSTGEREVFAGPFAAGHTWVLERPAE
jgi:uncharacterized membrane protein YraQ (UPF0718 family)